MILFTINRFRSSAKMTSCHGDGRRWSRRSIFRGAGGTAWHRSVWKGVESDAGGIRSRRRCCSGCGRRMTSFSANVPLSFYLRSKDDVVFGKCALILLPAVEG